MNPLKSFWVLLNKINHCPHPAQSISVLQLIKINGKIDWFIKINVSGKHSPMSIWAHLCFNQKLALQSPPPSPSSPASLPSSSISPYVRNATMSLLRNCSELDLSAPAPSPIPTGTGSRSACNEILSDYLAKSLKVPDLSLPDLHPPLNEADHIPAEIENPSLELRDYETIDRLLRSAREFGAFRITCHGIFGNELRSFVHEADRIFQDLERADIGLLGKSSGRNQNKEQIAWFRSRKERTKWISNYFLPEKYQDFSEKMDNIAIKLDAIAELLGNIFVENIARMQFGKRIQGNDSVLSLYRYNHSDNMLQHLSTLNKRNSKPCDFTFCLHLPATPSRFFLRSAHGPLSFDAGPDTIVVIVGHHIEEWSMGDFICVCKEVICVPHLQESQARVSIELKCLSLNFDPNSKKICNTISIRDQILFVLVIGFLYKIYVFLFS